MDNYTKHLIYDLAHYLYEQIGEPDVPKVFYDEEAQNLLKQYMNFEYLLNNQ